MPNIFELNVQLINNSIALSRSPRDEVARYVQRFASVANDIPTALHAFEDGHVYTHLGIPFQVVARINPDTGEQMRNESDDPLWDIKHLVVDACLLPEQEQLIRAVFQATQL